MTLYPATALSLLTLILVSYPNSSAALPIPAFSSAIFGSSTKAATLGTTGLRALDAGTSAGELFAQGARSGNTASKALDGGLSSADMTSQLRQIDATQDTYRMGKNIEGGSSIADTMPKLQRTKSASDMSSIAEQNLKRGASQSDLLTELRQFKTPVLRKSVMSQIGSASLSIVKAPFRFVRWVGKYIKDGRVKRAKDLLYRHDPSALTATEQAAAQVRKGEITTLGRLMRKTGANPIGWSSEVQNRQGVFKTAFKDTLFYKLFGKAQPKNEKALGGATARATDASGTAPEPTTSFVGGTHQLEVTPPSGAKPEVTPPPGAKPEGTPPSGATGEAIPLPDSTVPGSTFESVNDIGQGKTVPATTKSAKPQETSNWDALRAVFFGV